MRAGGTTRAPSADTRSSLPGNGPTARGKPTGETPGPRRSGFPRFVVAGPAPGRYSEVAESPIFSAAPLSGPAPDSHVRLLVFACFAEYLLQLRLG
jgi:hypothetical protein